LTHILALAVWLFSPGCKAGGSFEGGCGVTVRASP
jgi:hypothetical protein